VMSLGVLQQLDTPQNLYDSPDNKFVAGFMGSPSMNFVDVTIEEGDGGLYAANPGFRMRIPDNKAATLAGYKGQQVTMGVRPEHIVEQSRVPSGAVPEDAFIPVTVDVVELLGNEIFVYLTTRTSTLTARMDPDLKLERGQEVKIALEPSKLHFFDPKTEQTIR